MDKTWKATSILGLLFGFGFLVMIITLAGSGMQFSSPIRNNYLSDGNSELVFINGSDHSWIEKSQLNDAMRMKFRKIDMRRRELNNPILTDYRCEMKFSNTNKLGRMQFYQNIANYFSCKYVKNLGSLSEDIDQSIGKKIVCMHGTKTISSRHDTYANIISIIAKRCNMSIDISSPSILSKAVFDFAVDLYENVMSIQTKMVKPKRQQE